ncbi:MAG: hypothetical protein IJR49_06680 [Treponema sp.]|nr:hypothetical protein [Treponema sp.]
MKKFTAIKKITKKIVSLGFLSFALFFNSCMTLQRDVSISAESLKDDGFSQEVTESLVKIDAMLLLEPSKDFTQDLQKIITKIEKKLPTLELEKNISSRLYALNGRAHLLLGSRDDARKMYNQSIRLNPDDAEALLLGYRISVLKNLSEKQRQLQNPVLLIELARNAYSSFKYEEAVGLFDSAFLDLPDFYKSSYAKVRHDAWQKKDLDFTNVSTQNHLSKKVLQFQIC